MLGWMVPFAPGGIEIGGGFGGDDFFDRFAGGLQLFHPVRHGHQHFTVGLQRGFVAEGSVAGHDLRAVVGEGENLIDAADHAVDGAAAAQIDERVHAVEPQIAGMDDVALH